MQTLKPDTTYEWRNLSQLREVSRQEDLATYLALPYPAGIYRIGPDTYRMICQARVAPIASFTLKGTENEVLSTAQVILTVLGYKSGPYGLKPPRKIDMDKAIRLQQHPIVVKAEEW